ncbi:ABC-three component system middle component 1 [Desulfosporosinus nitroreducens]|uniref:Uncharacterized protein n=1 Tax=Desulfosporosinus nitroreducens TaxID=2018668 RepID=A0ABT8QWZ2_9FIRM|nr:ABC-three component system middle component 1 [Desulfosporosinus nitroreducens]MDO0825866.1 hypothetical protein [Desulfosporosinus nitroreducens]
MEGTKINEILSIIRTLNNGSVLSNQKDIDTKKELYSDMAQLFINEIDMKYYFFASFSTEKDNFEISNMGEIEKITINNTETYKAIDTPTPNSSYLVLFWEVPSIDESIYRHIIKLEENEFFFKKYVFYYTSEELKAFKKWFSEKISFNKGDIKTILNEISNEDFEKPEICFILRLLIKIPFFDLPFPKAVLQDFDEIVQNKILVIRGNNGKKIKDLNEMLTQTLSMETQNLNEIIELIYKKTIGE